MKLYPISTSASNGDFIGHAATPEEALAFYRKWLESRGESVPEIVGANLGPTIWNVPLDGEHISNEAWLPILA